MPMPAPARLGTTSDRAGLTDQSSAGSKEAEDPDSDRDQG